MIFSIIWNCITKIRIKLMFLLLVQLDRLVRSGLAAHKDSKGRAGDKAREATLDRSDRLVPKVTGIIKIVKINFMIFFAIILIIKIRGDRGEPGFGKVRIGFNPDEIH